MSEFLEFKKVQCKDCYRCLRECPVKAIDVIDHQAKIVEDRCILCGHCTLVCPQEAKIVHSELDVVRQLLAGDTPVIASVAPSFISSLEQENFTAVKIALAKLGFASSEETAVGARVVTQKYKEMLQEGTMRNFITSACPAACHLIQQYYPKALPYLAPVDSPMVVHAKLIKESQPNVKVVFIGPCIAKKREAAESDLIDAVITFEELRQMLAERDIKLENNSHLDINEMGATANLAKSYPLTRGIIHSFGERPKGYNYIAVDGVFRCMQALENIESLDHVFLELNVCPNGCINGPCSIKTPGGMIKAENEIHHYVKHELASKPMAEKEEPVTINIAKEYPRLRKPGRPATEREITDVLHRIGKFTPADELNCGACGYNTCREKAWAVVNGYTPAELCLPYIRKRSESLAVEIVHNSPEGVILVDAEMNIVDVNATAMHMLGIQGTPEQFQARPLYEVCPTTDFYIAYSQKRNVENPRLFIPATTSYVNLSVSMLNEQNLLFGIMKDVTDEVNYDNELEKLRLETISTTDSMIMKQMRVAQEIASLLGETTAETKVALLNLKKMLQESGKKEK